MRGIIILKAIDYIFQPKKKIIFIFFMDFFFLFKKNELKEIMCFF